MQTVKKMNNYKNILNIFTMRKTLLFIIFIFYYFHFINAQSISGELYDGGLYGSDASSDMTTTLTASSQYASGSAASPTIFVYRILQTEWDAANITSVSMVDNPLDMGNSGGPDSEWDDANGYHYLYFSAGVADWDLHDCPTSLGPNSTYLSLKFNGMSGSMTVYMTLKDTDPVVGSEVNRISTNQLTSVGSITLTTLPIKLKEFTVRKYNPTSSYLAWTTANEINFDKFIVERSTDSKNWSGIGEVKSFAFSRSNDYSFVDKDVYDGNGEQTFFYRLKMLDLDGGWRYSKVENVLFNTSKGIAKLMLFPNPSSEKVYFNLTNIESGSNLDINIFDSTGKLIMKKEQNYKLNNNLLIDNAKQSIKAGMYHVIISDNKGNKYYKKLILSR